MAVRNIDPNSSSDSGKEQSEMKPLVSKFGRKNPSIYKEVHRVIAGKVSSSGEWCILETEEYTVLVNMQTSAMKELFGNILPALQGKKANALVIQPTKKAKCGAIIAVDDEQQVWYTVDFEDETFETSPTKSKQDSKKSSSLNLSMFLGTNVDTDLANTTQKEQGVKPKSTKTQKVAETED